MPLRVSASAGDPGSESSRSSGWRWVAHAGLLLLYLTVSSALLLWPRWMEQDVVRSALMMQEGFEQDLEDRMRVVRAMHAQQRNWRDGTRKLLLQEELDSYPGLVRKAARHYGVKTVSVQLTRRSAPRWRELWVEAPAWDLSSSGGGRIEPRSVKVELDGGFDAVYRAVASLSEQRQLFVPDRWTLLPRPAHRGAATEVRAELWGTVFVVIDEEEPAPAVPAGGMGSSREVQG